MTVDEAKGLFALMGWKWEARALNHGNLARGRMPEPWQGRYEVFVNEVMEAERKAGAPGGFQQYENYNPARCLTRYAELYLEWMAEGAT